MLGPLQNKECVIRNVGKARNGSDRYWCSEHNATATGFGGVKLEKCELAYLDTIPKRILEIRENDFPGGIAIWGAVDPIYNTTKYSEQPGVHVHARNVEDGKKVHDETFDEVRFHYKNDLFNDNVVTITHDVAIAYYVSRYIGKNVKSLVCPHCRKAHLDKDAFAIKPHRRHLCHHCGRFFDDIQRGISNPVVFFRNLKDEYLKPREVISADKHLDIRQEDYPEGIAIWASNPALIWTAPRPEEKGIHVHAFGANIINDTYASVMIDGIEIETEYVAALMAQNALGYLKGRVVSLICPSCKSPHFDREDMAFKPHSNHKCDECETIFSQGQKLVVSNPLAEKLERLITLKQE